MSDAAADLRLLDAEQDWIEIRCGFPILEVPVIPWPKLAAAIARWREANALHQFFFTRKPPGLRLRLRPTSPSREFERQVEDWASELQRSGGMTRWARCVYEPEEARFGGPAAMEVAHALWSADAGSVLEYECLSEASRGSVTRVALWAKLLNDLLAQVLDDRAEVWEVWHKLADAVSQLEVEVPAALMDRYRAMAPSLLAPTQTWMPVLTPDVRRILERTRVSNRSARDRLRALSEGGEMSRGVRSWLAASALFQLNRWGLGLFGPELRALTSVMKEVLDPDRSEAVRNPARRLTL